jgi:acyl-CoA thioester hydrolase
MATAASLEDYPLRTFDKLRYGDTDRQGHVNNAVFSTFLETGRVELAFGSGEDLTDEGCSLVIAHLSLDFVTELLWPGRVDIGTGVIAVGRSSVRMEQALFQDGRLVALAETVTVQVNNATRRGQPLSERALAYLAGYRKAPLDRGAGAGS